jgi:hypothetical protein
MRYTLLLIAFVFAFAACKKPETDNSPSVDITSGTWRISYFWDVQDKTSNYSSFNFMFLSDGSLMAHGTSSMFTGTWSQTGSKININFASAPMNELNGEWLKTEFTGASIKLKDDNPSQDDQLYFVKN